MLLFICVLLTAPLCSAGDNVDVVTSPGMETIKEGDVNLVVYKGGRPHKQGDVVMTETPDEYTSRKFSSVEEHLKRIEKELEDLKSMVKKLEEDGRKK